MSTEQELTQEDKEWLAITKGTALADPEPITVEVPRETTAEAVAEPVKAEATTETIAEPAKSPEPVAAAATTVAEVATVPDPNAEPFPGFSALTDEAKAAYTAIAEKAREAETLKARAAALEAERNKFQADWRAQHGQLQPTQRALAQAQKELKALQDAQPKAGAKFEAWAAALPEDAAAIRDGMTPLQQEIAELRARDEQREQELQQIRVERETQRLSQKHPDYEDIVLAKGPDGRIARQEDGTPYWTQSFYDWWAQLPSNVQPLALGADANNWDWLLSTYKAQVAYKAPAATQAAALPQASPVAAAITQQRAQALKDTEPPIRPQQSPRNAAISDEDAQWAALTAGNPRFA